MQRLLEMLIHYSGFERENKQMVKNKKNLSRNPCNDVISAKRLPKVAHGRNKWNNNSLANNTKMQHKAIKKIRVFYLFVRQWESTLSLEMRLSDK